MSLLTDLDAFYLDHRRCGDLRAGVVDREQDTVVWLECQCSARIVRPIDALVELTALGRQAPRRRGAAWMMEPPGAHAATAG